MPQDPDAVAPLLPDGSNDALHRANEALLGHETLSAKKFWQYVQQA